MAEEDDARPGSDGVVEKIENLGGVLYGEGQSDFLHHYAVALGLEVPGMDAAGMFLVGHEHFVARFQVGAIGNVAISFGGITEQGDLVATATDEGGQGIAKLVPGGISPNRVVFGILLVHSLGGGVAVENGAQHGCWAGADGAVVQVDFVLRDEELAAHLGPVGVFVLIEESGVRQGGGGFLQLSQEISAASQGCGESRGGGGEEAASVKQGAPPDVSNTEGAML